MNVTFIHSSSSSSKKEMCKFPLISSSPGAYTDRLYSAVLILRNSEKIKSAIKLLCNENYNPAQKIIIGTNENRWFMASTHSSSTAHKDFISCITFHYSAVALTAVHAQVGGVFTCRGLFDLFSLQSANFLKFLILPDGASLRVFPTADGLDLGILPSREWSLTKPEIDLSFVFNESEAETTPPERKGFLRLLQLSRPQVPPPQFSFVRACRPRDNFFRIGDIPYLEKGDVSWNMTWFDLDILIEALSIGELGPAAGILANNLAFLRYDMSDFNLAFFSKADYVRKCA